MSAPYDPSTPLRADATGEQIESRFQHFRNLGPMLVVHPSAAVANEFAAAHLAAERARSVYAVREAVRTALDKVANDAEAVARGAVDNPIVLGTVMNTLVFVRAFRSTEYPALPAPEETTHEKA